MSQLKSDAHLGQKYTIGVIGSGISGLSSAFSLALEGHTVHLFEETDHCGGHSFTYHPDTKSVNTISSANKDGEEQSSVPVDLGFQVYNLTNYPYLTAWLQTLEVETETSDMSFSYSVSVQNERMEWASNDNGLAALFCQKKNLVNPKFIGMLREAMRFGKAAEEVLVDPKFASMSLGEYLNLRNFDDNFREIYLLPMTAAVWSVPGEQMLAFPAKTFVQFWKNHHLLNPLGDRPNWRVCKNRTEDYVSRVIDKMLALGVKIHTNSSVKRLIPVDNGDNFIIVYGVEETSSVKFDHIVFACHSNQAMKILQASSHESKFAEKEISLLQEIKYQVNDIYLHSDSRLMPESKSAWSSWNVLDSDNNVGETKSICVTYWLNHLQNLPKTCGLRLCTLNPIYPIAEEEIIQRFELEHPVFDLDMLAAREVINNDQQMRIKKPNSMLNKKIWFTGAWLGNGFHEDGIASAVRVSSVLNALARGSETPVFPKWIRAIRPEVLQGSTPSPLTSRKDTFFYYVFKTIMERGIIKGHFKVILPNGKEDIFGRKTISQAKDLKEPYATIYVKDMGIFLRFMRDSDVGLGEGFMEGLVDISSYSLDLMIKENFSVDDLNYITAQDELVSLFKILILNGKSISAILDSFSSMGSLLGIVGGIFYKIGNAFLALKHSLKKNTVMGSRRNIEAHYDLGNDMYKSFLDSTMTYSCGIHCDTHSLEGYNAKYSLIEAQYRKLDMIISKLDLKPNDYVLEIGCGWGSFATRAAIKSGCKVIGITISVEQLEYAKKLVYDQGLQNQVFLCICDYRKLGTSSVSIFDDKDLISELSGRNVDPGFLEEVNRRLTTEASFEKVASIEMIEAVGHEHLPEYFETINRMLVPSGKACIQGISLANDRYMAYMATSDFIREHIFPGGHLISVDAVKWALQNTNLALVGLEDIGRHYAVTLNCWKNNFIKNKDKVLALGYPESLIKKWIFYFAYCEAGFELGYILNFHFVLEKDKIRQRDDLMNYMSDPTTLKFGSEVHAKSAIKGKQAALASTTPGAHLPMISTLVPASFWLMAFMMGSKALQFISTIAVFAVFVTSLLGMLYSSYFIAPKNVAGKDKRVLWMQFYIDGHFAALVNVAVITSIVLHTNRDGYNIVSNAMVNPYLRVFDSFLVLNVLLFASFGKLAAANARSIKRSLPYFIDSVLTTIVMYFALQTSSAIAEPTFILGLLHGVGESHNVFRSIRKVSYLQGEKLETSFKLQILQKLEVFGVAMRVIPSCWYIFHNFIGKISEISSLSLAVTPDGLGVGWLVLALGILLVGDMVISVLSFWELYVDYENAVNTNILVKDKRFNKDRYDIIKNMAKSSQNNDQVFNVGKPGNKHIEQRNIITGLYAGYIFHSRKVQGKFSPGSNTFKYNTWMAFIDLNEVQSGLAFKNDWFISVNKFNLLQFDRNDYYGAETGKPLDVCIRELVQRNVDIDVTGPIRLLTNLKCFGYVFNSLSVFYCYDHAENLVAAVLEVSNTPWLHKRWFVLKSYPNPDHPGKFYCRFEKDFHVSPFFDVFYDYEWIITPPDLVQNKIAAQAYSYRRKSPEGVDSLSANYRWSHVTGDQPIVVKHGRVNDDETLFADKMKAFITRFEFKRTDNALLCFLWIPFMTFTAAWYIHYQAYVVMVRKGCGYQASPENQRVIGISDLLFNLMIFSVAVIWDVIMFLFIKPIRLAMSALGLF